MSWFKRKPRIKEPERQHPHHHSPLSEKLWKEVKDQHQMNRDDEALTKNKKPSEKKT